MTNRRPDADEMAAPLLEFDLAGEVERLQSEPEWKGGQNARTLVKHEDVRVVLIALRAGARIPNHQTGGRITIHTVRGHVRVRAQDQDRDLPLGNLLALDRALPHDVEALEDSAILLTIAWPGRG